MTTGRRVVIQRHSDLPTPDFYRYPWVALVSAELADDVVTVRWPDGRTLDCYSLWLAENTYGIEPRTREGTLDPAALPPPDHLRGAVVDEAGSLVLRWSDGAESSVHPGWLRHVADGGHRPGAQLPDPVPWTADHFEQPPTTDGRDILVDDDLLRRWLGDLCRYGIARLVGVGDDPDRMAEIAARVGPVRPSNFGGIFEVVAVVAPDSTANTGLALGQHTDLPTRETPPGFQFLHCVENTVAGGSSRLTDGLSVVEELRTAHPAAYEALTTLPWTFANRSTEADHRWTGPLIDQAAPDRPLTLRAFYPVRGFPAMDPADVPRAYDALRTFSMVAHDPRFQIVFPFAPGDVVGFDNRRVLHGRDAFDAEAGTRRLRGCYLDRDDVLSRLRVLNRRRVDEGPQLSASPS